MSKGVKGMKAKAKAASTKGARVVAHRGERAKEHAALYACARTNPRGALFQAAKARLGALLTRHGASTSETATSMGISTRSVQRLMLMLRLRARDASKDSSASARRR